MWLRGMFFFPEAGWESGHHNGKTTQSSGEGIERGGGGGGRGGALVVQCLSLNVKA